MMLNTLRAEAPTEKLKTKSQTSHSARSANSEKRHLFGMVQVKAHGQPQISLGNFTANNPPKGFSIHITPDPEPEAIVTQVTTLGSDKEYELILHIANYGNKTVNAKIWPL